MSKFNQRLPKRSLAVCVLATVLALSGFLTSGGPAGAQRLPPGQGEDGTQILAPGLYSLNWGPMGLNVGMFAGEDGILLVDAQDERALPRLKSEIAKRSGQSVRVVINTHWHFDHIGGNETFRTEGAVVVAHEATRARLMADQANPLGGEQRAFPATFWPMLTFPDSISLHFNGDDVDVVHVPNAHTDGDVIVRLRKANVLFAADLFNNGDYTRVDLRGGSLDGMISAYEKLLPTLDENVRVVPGRGRVGTKKDLVDYLSVMKALKTRITKLIEEGKSVEEAVALKPTADFDARWANGPIPANDIVEEVYADLKRKTR
jgi:glyoxylase-like metal-dependent hydrolase (beta-lactamase superfamily II)